MTFVPRLIIVSSVPAIILVVVLVVGLPRILGEYIFDRLLELRLLLRSVEVIIAPQLGAVPGNSCS